MAAEEPLTVQSAEADHHGGSGSGAGEERLVMYKTKLVQFLGRSTSIILQNDNGPCPLLAICNVLLLRNVIKLSPDVPEVSQDQLLAHVADRLVESNSEMKSKDEEYVSNQQQNISDAIDLLPRLATGIDVNVHFRKINDFEFTRECAIFDLLDIGLYHGWLVDPEDKATIGAIGSKSYNTLVGELVALEAQISEDRGIPPEEDTVDFAAATAATLGIPCPCLSRGRSFDDSLPVVPTEKAGRKGDLEEEAELLKALKLSRSEVSTESILIDKSLPPESTSSISSSDLEDGTIVETSDSRNNSENIVSETIDTHGIIHSPCLPLSKDENLSESSNTGAASFGIILENNTQSVKSGSVGHPDQSIPMQSEEIQTYTAPLSDVLASQESIPVAEVSDSSNVSCADKSQMNMPKDASLETKAFAEKSIGHSVDQINGDSLSPGICQSNVDAGRDSAKAHESVCPDLENGEPIYEGEECILDSGHSTYQSQEPVYEGEVVLANQVDKIEANTTSIQSDKEPSGRKNSGLTTISLEEGKLIHYFLENNASQLTIYGLFRLQEGLNERELCVFFRNNHFSTMFKFGGELYLLATDQGYINQPDLVWEKLNEVNGDTIFMTGNFTEFKMDNQNDSWSPQNAMTDTTEYLAALKGSTSEGSSLSSDLQLAIALQEQEFGRQSVCPEPQNPQPAPLTRPRLVTGPQVPRRQPPLKQEPKSKEKCAVM